LHYSVCTKSEEECACQKLIKINHKEEEEDSIESSKIWYKFYKNILEEGI